MTTKQYPCVATLGVAASATPALSDASGQLHVVSTATGTTGQAITDAINQAAMALSLPMGAFMADVEGATAPAVSAVLNPSTDVFVVA